ncbi:MAG: SDR family NAD(P)-dependent oxidoreductase, partial [Bacteroidales bacterium]|nr:SDR family NAD(P)-dependent oxidoreductase [Bacteroidales bacterium]
MKTVDIISIPPPPPQYTKNIQRYILITGASSGIGREIAIRLSDRYNIILNGRNNERLLETLEMCNKDRSHLIWQYDLMNI